MANKDFYRTIVLQTLFEIDITSATKEKVKDVVGYIIDNFISTDVDNAKEVISLTESILDKKELLDEVVEKAAIGWEISRMSIVDRNILRYSVYELLFADKDMVPEKVAINEAIELAKKFSGSKSGKFINGVLGAIYRELGEPGKDHQSKNKFGDVALEDMEIDKKGAAVIYSIDKNDVIRIGMVHDIFGYWTLSKGGIEDGETAEEGTVREAKEETNWDIEIISELGENEYIAYHPKRGPVRKQVKYFLAKADHVEPKLEVGTGGLDDVKWFELEKISDLTMYEDVSQMLIKAINIIAESNIKEDESISDPGERNEDTEIVDES